MERLLRSMLLNLRYVSLGLLLFGPPPFGVQGQQQCNHNVWEGRSNKQPLGNVLHAPKEGPIYAATEKVPPATIRTLTSPFTKARKMFFIFASSPHPLKRGRRTDISALHKTYSNYNTFVPAVGHAVMYVYWYPDNGRQCKSKSSYILSYIKPTYKKAGHKWSGCRSSIIWWNSV